MDWKHSESEAMTVRSGVMNEPGLPLVTYLREATHLWQEVFSLRGIQSEAFKPLLVIGSSCLEFRYWRVSVFFAGGRLLLLPLT